MPDAAKKLLAKLERIAYRKQKDDLKKFAGKFVERNGTKYLVKSINSKVASLISAGDPTLLITMQTKNFLGKKIKIIEDL